ncbi:hypothetical protein B484DRAFT_408417 [Ochromonadaceae sp. CCMP2298]|nr:hypothetical protein B484DRAFT_408417 [Ochromonadaceae sp. CCMP2298]
MAELEVAAMRDIRKVLDTARHSCVGIVAEVKASCLKQIAAIQPSRKPHRARMEARVKGLQRCWGEVEAILQPLVDDYRRYRTKLYKHLKLTKAQCMDVIGKYREREARDLEEKYRDEREGLIGSFRQHFR